MNEFEKALIKYLGEDNLEKIQRIKVGICGAGGLGSNVAASLVRSGFRDFVIADFDRVDTTNLNRQFFFFNQVGECKADALEENLKAVNKDISVKKHILKIDRDNAAAVFDGCDVLVEAVDRADVKPIIIETAMAIGAFCVSASGMAGVGGSDEMITRKFGDRLYIVGDFKSDIEKGVPPLAPRVNIAAAKEADLILEWVIGKI